MTGTARPVTTSELKEAADLVLAVIGSGGLIRRACDLHEYLLRWDEMPSLGPGIMNKRQAFGEQVRPFAAEAAEIGRRLPDAERMIASGTLPGTAGGAALMAGVGSARRFWDRIDAGVRDAVAAYRCPPWATPPDLSDGVTEGLIVRCHRAALRAVATDAELSPDQLPSPGLIRVMVDAYRPPVTSPRPGPHENTADTERDDATPGGADEPPVAAVATHAPNFEWVAWFGTMYQFVGGEREAVRALWECWKAGGPGLSQRTLLEATGSDGKRLRDVFKRKGVTNDAWGKMIRPVNGLKDVYTLALPKEIPQPRQSPA